MKKRYNKPEIKVVVLDSEDLLIILDGSQTTDQTPLSKGNSSFDNDSDWDD